MFEIFYMLYLCKSSLYAEAVFYWQFDQSREAHERAVSFHAIVDPHTKNYEVYTEALFSQIPVIQNVCAPVAAFS